MTLNSMGREPQAPWFFAALGLLAAIIVAAGFWRGYWQPLIAGTLDKEWVIDLHAAVFVGWIALFVTQATLVLKGRTDLHRRVGKFGIYYGFLIIAMGLFVAFNQLAYGIAAGKSAEAQSFLLIPLVDMVLFPAFFGAAVYYRRRPEFHMRLMLVATTALLIAPVARLDLGAFMAMDWSVFAIWLTPIYLAMIHDFLTKRIVHPVYVIGLSVLAVSMLRIPAAGSESWLVVARALSGWIG